MLKQHERQEQKLLYQAIKNSLLETKNTNSSLEDIEEMPVFYPTENEFKNPLEYIDNLYYNHHAHKYGCVKIIPPASFKPKNVFDMKSNRKLHSRRQVLQKLTQGVPFEQNYTGRTFKEYEAISKKMEKSDADVNWEDDKDIYEKVEKKYWDIVEY